MIKVKKNAIKYKNEEGNMQESGVICQVGTFGEDYSQYASNINFNNLNVFDKSEISIYLKHIKRIGSVFTQNVEKNTTVEHITLKTEQKLEFANAIFYTVSAYIDEYLKHITLYIDTSEVLNMSNIFSGLKALEVVDGEPLDFSSATNIGSILNGCLSLKEFRVKKESIKVSFPCSNAQSLSDESIQSIIDGLADLTGQEAQTITFHSTVKDKLTEEQITQIISKNWTLA